MSFYISPDLPFVSEIHGGIEDGRIITIKGRTNGGTVSINVKNKDDLDITGNDVGLHVSIRLHDDVAILNSMIKDTWKKEHKTKLSAVGDNDKFTLIITINDNHYQATLNKIDLGVISYKVPKEDCKFLFINGPVNVHSVQFSGPGIRRSSVDEKAMDLADDLKKTHEKQDNDKKEKKKKDKGEKKKKDKGEKEKKDKGEKKKKDKGEKKDGEKKKKDKKDKKGKKDKEEKKDNDEEKKSDEEGDEDKKKKGDDEGDEKKDSGDESDCSSSSCSSSSSNDEADDEAEKEYKEEKEEEKEEKEEEKEEKEDDEED